MTNSELHKLRRAKNEAFVYMLLSVAFAIVATAFAIFEVLR